MKRLSKKQAFKILPAVVDGEVSKELREAFLDIIKTDSDIRQEYEEALIMKKLLSERLTRVNAPKHLRVKVDEIIRDLVESNQFKDIETDNRSIHSMESVYDGDSMSKSILIPSLRYIAAAAIIMIITLTTMRLLQRVGSTESILPVTVENYTAIHFSNTNGKLDTHHFSTASTSEAEKYLKDHFGIMITIPRIAGAEFSGLLMSDFYGGLKAPLLEYRQPEIGENIFLFAFEVDELTRHKKIVRDSEAVNKCVLKTDFHIAEIDARHVVSWKWDNNWYTAVSNHNGFELASLIEPLNYSEQ